MSTTWSDAVTLFRQIYDSPTRAYTYLLADGGTQAAVAIDPEPEGTVLPLLGLVDELGLNLQCLLYTHVHDGDAAKLERLRERTGARIVAGIATPVAADIRVREGDTLEFGAETIRVLETPGHTTADVSYLWRDRVFTGDALLIRACGQTDRPGGDPGTLFDSITQRLLVLPGDTLVFPGHETHHRSVSTIAEERDFNPCIAGRSRDEFITQRCAR